MGSGCENRKEKGGDTEIEFCPGPKIGLYSHPISGLWLSCITKAFKLEASIRKIYLFLRYDQRFFYNWVAFSLPAGWYIVIFFLRVKQKWPLTFQFLFNLYQVGYLRASRCSLKFARSSTRTLVSKEFVFNLVTSPRIKPAFFTLQGYNLLTSFHRQ